MTKAENDSSEASAGPEDKPMTWAEREAFLKAGAEAAAQAMMAALAAYIEAIKTHHGFVQWGEGFDRGWKASREHLREELKKSVQQEFRSGVGVSGAPGINLMGGLMDFLEPYPLPVQPSPLPTAPKASDLVQQFINQNPGKRGIQIVEHFNSTIFFRLPERTVRTALHRLKRAEKIKIVDGRWYPIEVTPAAPQLELQE